MLTAYSDKTGQKFLFQVKNFNKNFPHSHTKKQQCFIHSMLLLLRRHTFCCIESADFQFCYFATNQMEEGEIARARCLNAINPGFDIPPPKIPSFASGETPFFYRKSIYLATMEMTILLPTGTGRSLGVEMSRRLKRVNQ